MTRQEALDHAIAAARQAEFELRRQEADASFAWSALADTWASISRELPPSTDLAGGFVMAPEVRNNP